MQQLHMRSNQPIFPATNQLLRQRGIGLVEVLLAVILVSIGIFATLRLSLSNVKESTGQKSLQIANRMANDWREKLASNPQAAKSGVYDRADYQPITQASTESPCTSTCTAENLAQKDQAQWSNLALKSLVNPSYILLRDSAAGASVTWFDLWVTWDEVQNLKTAPAPVLGTQCPTAVPTPNVGTRQCLYRRFAL